MRKGDKKKKEIGKTIFKSIKNCLMIVLGYSKVYILFNLFVIIIQGLMPAILIVIMQRIINMLQCAENEFLDIISYVGIYVFLDIFIAIISTLYSFYNSQFSLRFTQYVDMKILDKSVQLKLKDYEDPETYNIINRAQSQNGESILTYILNMLEMLRQFFTIGSTTIVLIRFKWWIILIVLVVPIVKCAVTICIDRQWYELRIARTQKERQNWYINYVLLTGQAFKEIKVLGLSEYLIQKYRERSDSFIKEDRKMQRKTAVVAVISDIIDRVIMGVMFAYTVSLGVVGKLLIGDVTAYLECIENIKNSAQGIFVEIGRIADQSLYIDFLFEYLHIPVQKQEVKKQIAHIEKIELKHVSFQYDKKYVLKDISLSVYRGERIALIGQNGSGKTTLIKLILGFYDNYEGEIYINGVELREIGLESYRKRIGCVFQDYEKYEATLRENVAFGDLDKISNDGDIWNALDIVRLQNQIREIGGLDATIGNWFGSQELSAGEWQRVAIARALIKDADMYVFDEPDASLDIMKQKELILIYENILSERIGIYISHKVNFVYLIADTIYVLHKGKLVEKGKHEDLLSHKEWYYLLFKNCNNLDDIN